MELVKHAVRWLFLAIWRIRGATGLRRVPAVFHFHDDFPQDGPRVGGTVGYALPGVGVRVRFGRDGADRREGKPRQQSGKGPGRGDH